MKKNYLTLAFLFLCSCSETVIEEEALFMGDEILSEDHPEFSEIQPVEPTPFEPLELEEETVIETTLDSDADENIQIKEETFFTREEPVKRETYPVMITLQYTGKPTSFVQCLSTDEACFKNYTEQGYRPLSHIPQFAGFRDVLSSSDYPGDNRWRDHNNIPRW